MPERMSEYMPGSMSDRMSEFMPEIVPDRMSEYMPESMSDTISVVIELHHDFLPLAICSGIRIFFVVSFVFISSEFRQTFRRVLCGKTFCHKILPQILSSEFR